MHKENMEYKTKQKKLRSHFYVAKEPSRFDRFLQFRSSLFFAIRNRESNDACYIPSSKLFIHDDDDDDDDELLYMTL